MSTDSVQTNLPRLAEEFAFPSYAFVPGHHPHPTRNPEGHSFEHTFMRVLPLTHDNWRTNRLYLFGIDLFNHGYYWESHEVWEEIWHASGHDTDEGVFLKSLIKLSAAGVKVRENMASGIRTHGINAGEGFEQLREKHNTASYMGLSLSGLVAFAWRIETSPPRSILPPTEREIVFKTVLEPM